MKEWDNDRHEEALRRRECKKLEIYKFEQIVKELNCVHADEHGVCELLSDNSVKNYCPLLPCNGYEEKTK